MATADPLRAYPQPDWNILPASYKPKPRFLTEPIRQIASYALFSLAFVSVTTAITFIATPFPPIGLSLFLAIAGIAAFILGIKILLRPSTLEDPSFAKMQRQMWSDLVQKKACRYAVAQKSTPELFKANVLVYEDFVKLFKRDLRDPELKWGSLENFYEKDFFTDLSLDSESSLLMERKFFDYYKVHKTSKELVEQFPYGKLEVTPEKLKESFTLWAIESYMNGDFFKRDQRYAYSFFRERYDWPSIQKVLEQTAGLKDSFRAKIVARNTPLRDFTPEERTFLGL